MVESRRRCAGVWVRGCNLSMELICLSYVCIAVQEHWRCPEDLWGGPHICPMRSGLGWGWGAPRRGFTPEGQEEDHQRPFGGVLQWQPWDWRMPGVRGLDCLINCTTPSAFQLVWSASEWSQFWFASWIMVTSICSLVYHRLCVVKGALGM